MNYTSLTAYHTGANSHNDVTINGLWERGSGFIDNWNSGAGKPPSGSHFNGFQALHYSSSSVYHHGMQMLMSAGNPGLTFLRGWWANGGTGYAWQKIWTDGNDGSGSGLDADTVDSIQASSFIRLDTSSTQTQTAQTKLKAHSNAWTGGLALISQDGTDTFQIHPDNNGYMYIDKTWYFTAAPHVGSIGNSVWHAGNDGSGSGLDADLLDGKSHENFGATLATYGSTSSATGRIRCTAPFGTNSGHMFQVTISVYSSYNQDTYVVGGYMYSTPNQWYLPKCVYYGTKNPDIIVGRDGNGKAYISIANGNYAGVRVHSMTRGYQTSVADTYDPWTITIDGGTENSVACTVSKVWHSTNDGSGSGLDADLLDGANADTAATGSTIVQRDSNAMITAKKLYLNGGNYEGSIVFGATDSWRTGIRQHDDADAELRIWAKNANGRIHIATGYDGQPTSISRPTDGFVVDHNNVGIGAFHGSDPSEKLHVKGNILASGNITAYSDERLKSDIQTLDGKKVLQMRGVSFTKDGEAGSGVIAQELEKVAPELVRDGEYKSVAYGNITGYLIEAIKEQSAQINAQQEQINQLTILVKSLTEK